ncbi:hypothetical protein CkaCkLH20_03738 [Colletotrichum karsti]|uniref:Cellulose-binding family II n=1 Tax=Colletotrichum karsti TaxID=1095194 RepID=A0A9P6I9J8_9PEZI|nr:uncharacterized protein CkaCkLH20_03738 [Colletotrichum karsti]KAF9878838.1 hypothetical protein CkaCkLH20_03738 [Colletotrichum karsti]
MAATMAKRAAESANRTLPAAERQLFESVYKKSVQEWMRWLPGWDNFPFESVNVNVVGWAARSKFQIQGSTGGIDVHTGFNDDQGYPTCNPGCSRELHPDGDFSGCPGGPERRFHQFLLLDPSWGEFNMGAASSAGVSISLYGWETIGSQGKDWPMLVHEFGHSISFPDFLDDFTRPKNRTICSILWIPENAPEKFVMCPGSGGFDMPPALTDMEGWMLRHWWSRFSRLRGWQSDNVTWPAPRNCPQIETRQLGSKGNNQQLRDLH